MLFDVQATAPENAHGMQVFIIADDQTPISAIPSFCRRGLHAREDHRPKVIDNVHAAIDGPNSLVQQKPETIADKLQSAWATFTDGLNGQPLGTTQSALPVDVHAAAIEITTKVDDAVTAAGQAQETVQSSHQRTTPMLPPEATLRPTTAQARIHPWTIPTNSRWGPKYTLFYNGTSGYQSQTGLAAGADSTLGRITLKTHPVAQAGEQFYIEFMAIRDYDYNGTNALSRLRAELQR
jgi:hypothetical protein